MPRDEVTIGPVTFEYDERSRFVGVVKGGEELDGTFECSPETWEAFAEAAEDKDVPEAGETLTIFTCPADSCRFTSMTPGPCRSHPYPLRAMGPEMVETKVRVISRG